ncbi:hypothetical protein Cgig2_033912 [Carnegiea gigantea]|uniref:Late embryogenesis abundant protein LEA-2 subgroup domain-containing protein n=1 Tax=Carnegiea gigantea TaxID=171969 RepID=A0A9Q1JIE4_9CARY|nr:hypothetical protein Cgig2_033912 [Carnegiea gigantea]
MTYQDSDSVEEISRSHLSRNGKPPKMDYQSEPKQSCCRWCCRFLFFTAGLTALFLWLKLRTSSPTCSIDQFDAFALEKTANSTQTKTTNDTIYYDHKLKNRSNDAGFYYDAFCFSFSYASKPIGNATCSAFCQGHEKATHRIGSFDAPPWVNWENVTTAVSANGSAVFRAELATRRNGIVWWWRLTCKSMSEPEQGCCRCCCSFIFTAGLTALFLWLSLRPSSPTCSIEQFDAFALNKTSNSTTQTKTKTKTTNHTLYYDLKLKNRNKDMGVYYDALNLTFYYASRPIGNATYPAFYQGHQKDTHRIGSFDATRGVNWENATAVVSTNGSAVFRVELATAVRYKIIFWKTKQHRLVMAADLHVNDQGSLVKGKKNKGITLSSGAAKIKGCLHFVDRPTYQLVQNPLAY